jgi:hypothetical protein
MNQARGIGGRGRQVVPRQNVQARVTNLNHQLRGSKFIPPPYPRTFTAVPWNSFTCEFEQAVTGASSSELEIDVSAVRQVMQTKVGTGSLKLKVVRYEAWCTADGLSYPTLKASFFDLGDQDTLIPEARSQQSDRGTLNMPAKVGFLPPMTDQKKVLGVNDTDIKLCTVNSGGAESGMVLLVRVHVLWKYAQASF